MTSRKQIQPQKSLFDFNALSNDRNKTKSDELKNYSRTIAINLNLKIKTFKTKQKKADCRKITAVDALDAHRD